MGWEAPKESKASYGVKFSLGSNIESRIAGRRWRWDLSHRPEYSDI